MKTNCLVFSLALGLVSSPVIGQDGLLANVASTSGPEGCGRVSAFTSMPRSKQLFPIILRRIDGVEMASGAAPNFRLSTGKHVLMLADAIPPVELTNNERAKLRQLRNRRMEQFKFFEIDVQPDTTYYLAAKLAASYPRDVTSNDHWEPVVWKQVSQRCR